jgi:hypothetical protein
MFPVLYPNSRLISPTLLATKAFQFCGSLLIQARVIVESHQAVNVLSGKFSVSIVERMSCAKSKAPHNSNLGSEILFFTGATFVSKFT